MDDKPRRYGVWAGCPNGIPENLSNCVEEVARYQNRWPTYGQCARKRGHGEGGLYCKQHAKMREGVSK